MTRYIEMVQNNPLASWTVEGWRKEKEASRKRSKEAGERVCMSGRALIELYGGPVLVGLHWDLPIACEEGPVTIGADNRRVLNSSDVVMCVYAGEPLPYELSCPKCLVLWDAALSRSKLPWPLK